MDFLVAGLGNPGPEHARDRHNIGWMVVDELARRHDGSFRSKFRGRLGDVRVGEAKLALLKPETYMNESGASIQAAAAFYKLPGEQVLVVHDDVDLETGRLQARLGGGLAGHNGLRSIAQRLGSQDFLRLRVGVGRPGRGDPRRSRTTSFPPSRPRTMPRRSSAAPATPSKRWRRTVSKRRNAASTSAARPRRASGRACVCLTKVGTHSARSRRTPGTGSRVA